MSNTCINYALLIGINYIGTDNQLSGCINDTLNLKQMIIGNQYFNENDITMMNDTHPPTDPLYPSKSNILKQFNNLVTISNSVTNLNRKINILIAYSGHGSYIRDTNGDEQDGFDEVLCPVDFSQSGFIVDDDLRSQLIDRLGSNVTLLMLADACHSATMLDLRYLYQCDDKHSYTTQSKISETKCKVVMISGCRDDQTSADAYIANKKSYQGAMTASLLACFNKTITYDNLVNTMRTWLKSGNYSQIPQLTSGQLINISDPFILTNYGYNVTPQPQPQPPAPPSPVPNLDIIKSVIYGLGKKFYDVTIKFKNYFVSGQSQITISNKLFGDPCYGKVKQLVVTFNNNTTKVFKENQTIGLPAA